MGKRPLLPFAAGVMVGVVLGGASRWLLALSALAIVIAFALALHTKRIRVTGTLLLWTFLPGLLLGFVRQEWLLAEMQERFRPWQDTRVVVEGVVDAAPRQAAYGLVLDVDVETIHTGTGEAAVSPGGRVRVTWFGEHPDFLPQYGDRLRLAGTLRLPEGRRNPGGFDMAMYLASRGVTGQMTLSGAPERMAAGLGNRLVATGIRLRVASVEKLHRMLPPQAAAVLSGMLLGDTEALDPELEAAFRTAGLSHLMAVSGANIAFVLMPVLWGLRRLGVHRRRTSMLSVPLLVLYVLMTGFEASIVRAALMAAWMLAGGMLWRKPDMPVSLAGSLSVMLLLNSAWLFDAGFQLSYLATGAIAMFCGPLAEKLPSRMPKTLRETLSATLTAQVGVMPVLAGSFHAVSLVSIPVNLIVVPVTGALTIVGVLLLILGFAAPAAGALAGQVVGGFVDGVCRFVVLSASVPHASVAVPSPGVLLTGLYVGWLLLLRFGHGRIPGEVRPRVLAAALVLTVVLVGLRMMPSPRLRITVLDVGQGDAIVIRTPAGACLVVDGGGMPADSEGTRIGTRVLLPFLLHEGVRAPDLLISTHPHADHLQGLETVAALAGADGIVLPADVRGYDAPGGLKDIAREREIPVREVRAGDLVWEEQDLRLTVLSPDRELAVGAEDPNQASLVLLLTWRSFSMLLTGDAGSMAESGFVARLPAQPVNVLKVGHHGSSGATGDALLDRLQPEAAVISVGRNTYGHPSEEVMDRLAERLTATHVTRLEGAWMLVTNGRRWRSSAQVRPVRSVFLHD